MEKYLLMKREKKNTINKTKRVFVVLCILTCLCFWKGHAYIKDWKPVLKRIPSLSQNAVNMKESNTATSNNSGSRIEHAHIILLWTGPKYFNLDVTAPDFMLRRCKMSNCRFTYDKHEYSKASAFLFHARNLNNTSELPVLRYPWQYYVLYHRDRPALVKLNLTDFAGLFNLTMTYRLDSDVPVTYGLTLKQTEHGRQRVLQQLNSTNLLNNKKKLVAWFVSHCKTDSQREVYVKELQRYIPVDVYGACGNFSCSAKDNFWGCYKMVEKEYKFYLSFENSFCKDYVTEKVFNALAFYIVPVVMGSANYSKYIPPNSYINVDNFTSPRHLAQYLKMLSLDPVKYMDYFSWKKNYLVKSTWSIIRDSFCNLCKVISQKPVKKKIYNNLEQWQLGFCYPDTIKTLL